MVSINDGKPHFFNRRYDFTIEGLRDHGRNPTD